MSVGTILALAYLIVGLTLAGLWWAVMFDGLGSGGDADADHAVDLVNLSLREPATRARTAVGLITLIFMLIAAWPALLAYAAYQARKLS